MLKNKRLCDLQARQIMRLSACRFVWTLSLMVVLSLGSCSKETGDDYVINGNKLKFSVVKADGWNTNPQSRAVVSGCAAESGQAGTYPADSIAGIFTLNGENLSDTLFLHASVTNRIVNGKTTAETNSFQTRATPVGEDTFYNSFGVLASVYTGDWDEDSCLPNYMYDVEVTKASSWTTSYYWPGAWRKMRFFAYAPYGGEGIALSDATKSGTPSITYTVPTDVSNQQDVLIAVSGEKAGDARTDISLPFNHALTAVRFVTGNILAGKITKISLKGVYGSASLPIKEAAEWSNHDSVKDFSRTLSSTITGTPGEEITSAESTFMMIPQTLPAGAKIEITYKDDATGTSRTLSSNIGGSEWPVGKSVTYAISASSIIKTTEFVITEPASVTYKGGNTEYSVTSYATIYTTGGRSKSVPIKWKAEFVEEDSNGNYIVIPKPEWVTAFTESDNGGTSAVKYTASIAEQQGIVSGFDHDSALQVTPPISGVYDLSTNGGTTAMNTANCYLINAPGTYSLPLVYGNAIKNGETNTSAYISKASGDYILKNFVNHNNDVITDPYIYNNAYCTPDNAVLVWQDEQELVNSTSVQLTDNDNDGTYDHLQFEVPQANIKQGNAVLAVRDASNTIMWSWHIWVTGCRLGEDDITTVSESGVQYNFMPINLGWCQENVETTYHSRSVGIRFTQPETGLVQTVTLIQNGKYGHAKGNNTYYQYGRKDPEVPSVYEYSGTTVITKYKQYYPTSGYDKVSEERLVSIHIAIRNPETHYYYSHEFSNNWSSSNFINLWNTDTTSAVTKTIYDPSPSGYKLPPLDAFSGFTYDEAITYFTLLSSHRSTSLSIGRCWLASPLASVTKYSTRTSMYGYLVSINAIDETIGRDSYSCATAFCVRPVQED